MAYPVVSGNAADPGTILFVGDYVNKNTPLWLSMFGPKPGPGNVEVSSITVSGGGFVSLGAVPSTISTAATYAPVIFNRVANTELSASGIMMNESHLVPGITPDEEFITVTKDQGLMYDDLAMNGIQLFGDTSTDPTVNTGCAGRLYGIPAIGSISSSVILSANSFNTSTINGRTLNISQVGTISTINAVNLNVSNVANISTLNTSTITTNTLNAITFISTNTAVAQNVDAGTANISTANISTANISTANISTANIGSSRVAVANISTANVNLANISTANISTASISTLDCRLGNFSTLNSYTANISSAMTAGTVYLQTPTPGSNASFAIFPQFAGVSGRGGTITTAPGTGGLDIYLGGANVQSLTNLAVRMTPPGDILIPKLLTVSTTTTNTLNANLISTGSIRTAAISISTINFRPSVSLSPSVDLGLGGAIGGLIGGASANGFNTLLGASALGTGIAGLVMPRTQGGLNSNTFQTIAGTSQIQFSTLGAITTSGFLTTTNGVGVYGSTISTTTTIPANAWAFRTVSDPLNLATDNPTLGATSTIQAVGQWNKAFPGDVSMDTNNRITTLRSQNTINMGGASSDPFRIDTNFAGSDPNIRLNCSGAVVIEGGGRLNVPAIEAVSSINGVVYPPPDQTIPIGSMLMWPVGNYANITPTAPPGYLLCDGSLQSSATYPVLAATLQNFWNPAYPAANPSGQFYLPATQGRMPIGGLVNQYNVTGTFQGLITITLPNGTTRIGGTFSNLQLANSNGTPLAGGGACVLYKGMYATSPSASGRIVAILNSTGGWASTVALLFTSAFATAVPVGTLFNFSNAQTNPGDFSKEYPAVGWTNPDGTVLIGSHPGYGTPYRVQSGTEVGVHNHQFGQGGIGAPSGGSFSAGTPNTGSNPTTNNNGLYQIGGVAVPEASYQNPPNFGVNYIIKAL
jgi:uncharacterized protein YjbI with pentapeptide repeats